MFFTRFGVFVDVSEYLQVFVTGTKLGVFSKFLIFEIKWKMRSRSALRWVRLVWWP